MNQTNQPYDTGRPAKELWVVTIRHQNWFDNDQLVFLTHEAAEKHAQERGKEEDRDDYIAVTLADQVNNYGEEMSYQARIDD